MAHRIKPDCELGVIDDLTALLDETWHEPRASGRRGSRDLAMVQRPTSPRGRS
jgi:hypothetical protein